MPGKDQSARKGNDAEKEEDREFSEAISFLWQTFKVKIKGSIAVLRVPFWIVGILPLYIGWSLSSMSIFPDLTGWLAAFIIGPLTAGHALAFNEFSDRKVDTFNPRKDLAALVRGLVSPRFVLVLSIVLAVLALVLSLLINLSFLLLVAMCIFLSFLYSARPFRLKSRPGLDLLVNAVGIGGVLPLAGWSIEGNPLDFPFLYLAPIILTIGSLYLPTTVADYHADFISNLDTIAVRLGQKRTLHLGFALSLSGAFSSGMLATLGIVHSGRIMIALSPIIIAQQVLYGWSFLRGVPSLKNNLTAIVGLCALHAGGMFLFLLHHTGTLELV